MSEIIITPIEKSEIDECCDICSDAFEIVMPKHSIPTYLKSIANWRLSVKAKYEDKIVGCYILNETSFPIRKGGIIKRYSPIQGIGLAVDLKHRGLGIGKKLRQYPLTLNYDYIWGAHSKLLNNINEWLKFGRKVIYEDITQFITIMPINEDVRKHLFTLHHVYQPDCITCGPTCVLMVLSYFNIHTHTVYSLASICETNSSTGTIHTGIERALNHFNIVNERNITNNIITSINKLNDMLDYGSIFIMRTLINNYKHWIIVYGKSNGMNGQMLYHIADPAVGCYDLTDDQIVSIWQPREFDGFFVKTDTVKQSAGKI